MLLNKMNLNWHHFGYSKTIKETNQPGRLSQPHPQPPPEGTPGRSDSLHTPPALRPASEGYDAPVVAFGWENRGFE